MSIFGRLVLAGFTEGLREGASSSFRAAISEAVHGRHVPSLSSRMSANLRSTFRN